MNKNGLLKTLITSHRQIDRYIFYFEKSLGDEFVPSERLKIDQRLLTNPGVVGNWSVLDLLAYLVDGEQSWLAWWLSDDRSNTGQHLLPPSGPPPDDVQNRPARVSTSPAEQILAGYRASFPQLIVSLKVIPEDEFEKLITFPSRQSQPLVETILEATAHRYNWAKVQIRHWLSLHETGKNNRAELLKKIEREHNLFEKSLGDLSPDEWLQPGVVADWTVKDLLAHLTAWEGFFRNWYLSGVQNEKPAVPAPGYSWRLIDRLNEQILLTNRDRPVSVICSEFRVSYQETFALIRSIPEEEIFMSGRFAWTGKINLYGYIIANTCNHYRWARSKLRAWKPD